MYKSLDLTIRYEAMSPPTPTYKNGFLPKLDHEHTYAKGLGREGDIHCAKILL